MSVGQIKGKMKFYLALLLLALTSEQVFLLPINDEHMVNNNNIDTAKHPNKETAEQTLKVQEDNKQNNAWIDDDLNFEADEQNSEPTEQIYEATEQTHEDYVWTDEDLAELENHNEHNKVKSGMTDLLNKSNSYENTRVLNIIVDNQIDDDIDAARLADGQAVLVRVRRNRHRGHAHYRGRDKKITKKKKKNKSRTGKIEIGARTRWLSGEFNIFYLPNKEK